MARINFVVPPIDEFKFTGGLLCIFEYANGLSELGHEVVVTPLYPSPHPKWFKPKFSIANPQTSSMKNSLLGVAKSLLDYSRSKDKNKVRAAVNNLLTHFTRYSGYSLRKGGYQQLFSGSTQKRDFDVVVATSFETAFVASAYYEANKIYFIQHYEPYFSVDLDDPWGAKIDAELSYFLDMNIVANSSWLAGTLKSKHNIDVFGVNPNAIDFEVFHPERSRTSDEFVVISYGGRLATWKGFKEAAEAIRIVRQTIPDLKWQVFGDALLPPDNDVAPYEALGFISGGTLRKAYSNADVCLCPSWYESFPLYPLEAMACGAVVVTTPFGTEDYATDGHNALFVPPKDSQAMADAIIRLYHDRKLLSQMRENGLKSSKEFTWTHAIRNMDQKIKAILHMDQAVDAVL
ncbi:glycosyltransferase family 4 protein [Deinococcus roseus]|uniref:Glycosyl transferase family 1 domain-containing protein n=1 Tax=Deinococcus roseus TaxID=392414 RepID=A0ABQ2CZA6_9DEIO|nr:glycosyltransferase family 4 protein [Deinococcus roseus]GGJ35344.1 hypothetical protein GCM10008938_21750 [Deinococcus roseus]